MKYSDIASALIKKVKFAQLLEARIQRDKARLTTLAQEVFANGGLADNITQFRVERDRKAKKLMFDRLEARKEVSA